MAANQQHAEYAIETSNLNLWYGDFQALLNVCTKIKAGIITGLIGPSGCGKTTLLRCFNRMNERFENVRVEGSVEILGSNIYDPEVSVVELRKRVGMVFQRPNPLPLSIYDNVAFGLKVHSPWRSLYKDDIDAAVEKALEEVFLLDSVKDQLHRKGTDLQLEQQQKLCIARLLPLKPELLLMDEPCSALDAAGTEAVEDLLLSLRGRYTIVIVTHNMAQARRISDECIYMLNGKLIEHGETSDIFLNPKDKRTEEYIEGRYG
ncbi:MAG: phosphate ABC transporter ATP-binding protein [Sedimentisphaerales bacterium]|nr:phosphate ABC transporter ATP-binding protein [Sedimentisphaerales bacterium]